MLKTDIYSFFCPNPLRAIRWRSTMSTFCSSDHQRFQGFIWKEACPRGCIVNRFGRRFGRAPCGHNTIHMPAIGGKVRKRCPLHFRPFNKRLQMWAHHHYGGLWRWHDTVSLPAVARDRQAPERHVGIVGAPTATVTFHSERAGLMIAVGHMLLSVPVSSPSHAHLNPFHA